MCFRSVLLLVTVLAVQSVSVDALVPFIDGGKGIPKLYEGYFNEQIAKQAATAVSKAVSAGKKKIEVNFPPVPNVDGEYTRAERMVGGLVKKV
jgi:hypothetical protein